MEGYDGVNEEAGVELTKRWFIMRETGQGIVCDDNGVLRGKGLKITRGLQELRRE